MVYPGTMKRKGNAQIEASRDAMAKARREAIVADAREGRVLRASTYVDRKKEASRKACKRRASWE